MFSNPYTTDNIQSLRALWLALRDLYATRVESLEGQIHFEKVGLMLHVCGWAMFGKNVLSFHSAPPHRCNMLLHLALTLTFTLNPNLIPSFLYYSKYQVGNLSEDQLTDIREVFNHFDTSGN